MQWNGHVFETRQGGQQIEKLKNEPDFVAPHAGQVVIGKSAQPAAVNLDLARAGRVQPADQIQQRGFAGAGRPDDGHHLTARDGEIHVFQRRHLAFAAEYFADFGEIDHLLTIMSRNPRG